MSQDNRDKLTKASAALLDKKSNFIDFDLIHSNCLDEKCLVKSYAKASFTKSMSTGEHGAWSMGKWRGNKSPHVC